MYGVIDETFLSLRSPRIVDSACETLSGAWSEAQSMIEGGSEQVAIVRARWSERHGCHFEMGEGEVISIDARDWTEEEE